MIDDEFSLENDFDEKIKNIDCIIIDEENYLYDGIKIISLAVEKCEDVHLLGPNYLRKVL